MRPILLARHGNLHYLTLEYLAELTMSILALQKQKDPQAGFAGDFLDVLDAARSRTRSAAAAQDHHQRRRHESVRLRAPGPGNSARSRACRGASPLSTATICCRAWMRLLAQGESLRQPGHRRTAGVRSATRVVSANAYLGAGPIAEALQMGADIVITGRVADASLTVAPAVHEFGWDWQDWDRLAGATVAGHLIECGAQATGGLWCNWQEAANLGDVGYPFVDLEPDGSFVISQAGRSGGAVNIETVSEQLLYEVADPAAYFTPDVVADFTSVTLDPARPRRACTCRRHGAGRPPIRTRFRSPTATASGQRHPGHARPRRAGQGQAVRRHDVSNGWNASASFASGSNIEVLGDRRLRAGRAASGQPIRLEVVLRVSGAGFAQGRWSSVSPRNSPRW